MTNNLEKNLELRKALAEVDRLTAKIVHLESYLDHKIKSETIDLEWLKENNTYDYDPRKPQKFSSFPIRIYNREAAIRIYQEILNFIK